VVDLLERPGVIEGVSPGFYFQRCLDIWSSDLLTTIDRKVPALSALQRAPKGRPLPRRDDPPLASRLAAGDMALLDAIAARQGATFQALRASAAGALGLSLENVSPFVTGIGQAHPLETGFAFLKPYGIPYLAGSGVKGAVRAACAADWEERCPGRRAELLLHYFGSDDRRQGRKRDDDGARHRRGALVFFDLFPERPRRDTSGTSWNWADAIRVDIVNPHVGNYYQGKEPPAEWLQPSPSNFLTLRPGLRWTLRLLYRPSVSAARPGWEGEIRPGLETALTGYGLGAKKSWGYGLFDILDDRRGGGVPPARDRTGAAPLSPAAAAREPGARPAPVPRRSAAAQALESTIQALKSNDVRGRLSQLERDLGACRPEERAELLGLLERRLESFGWKTKDRSPVMDRLRRAVGPPEA